MVKNLKTVEKVCVFLMLLSFLLIVSKYFNLSNFKSISPIAIRYRMTFDYFRLRLKYPRIINGSIVENNSTSKQSTQAIPVLMYHGILDEESGENISKERFIDQMLTLKRLGYQTITIYQFYNFVNGKMDGIPDKPILITFDDGRRESYYPVDPVLRLLDFNAVMFVITNRISDQAVGKHFLSEFELMTMSDSGRWDIQSHGNENHNLTTVDLVGKKGHFMSNRKWLEELERSETDFEFRERIILDLQYSKKRLEEITGKPVISYAFPFGDFGQDVIDSKVIVPIVKDVSSGIYLISFFQFRPEASTGFYKFNYVTDSQERFFRRILVPPNSNGKWLEEYLRSGLPKILNFEYDYKNSFHWVTGTSKYDIQIEEDEIILKANDGIDTVSSYLDGGQAWDDYVFQSKVRLTKGNQYALIVRSIDGFNYVACVYDDNSVYIKQVIEGKDDILSKSSKTIIFNPKTMNNVSVYVKGKIGGCYINDKLVVHTSLLDNSIDHGSVGYKVWGEKGQSSIKVQNILIEEL